MNILDFKSRGVTDQYQKKLQALEKSALPFYVDGRIVANIGLTFQHICSIFFLNNHFIPSCFIHDLFISLFPFHMHLFFVDVLMN